MSNAVHWLSFDVEEHFHAEAAAVAIDRADWPNQSCRLERSVATILQALADHQARATFFVLGWVARHEPEVVKRIVAAGHPLASHGMSHHMLHRLDAHAFRAELIDSRHLLEDLAGGPVMGFRAPTFSITRQTAWALDVLADAGYRYDSSIFPIHHDRYGVPDAPPGPHWALGPGGARILEVPPLTTRLFGGNFPVGGGGYFRLLPGFVCQAAVRRAQRRGRSAMIYLHPWEFDPGHPKLPMGRLGTFRHRVGLRHTDRKLRRLLARFSFDAIENHLDRCDPEESFAYAETAPVG